MVPVVPYARRRGSGGERVPFTSLRDVFGGRSEGGGAGSEGVGVFVVVVGGSRVWGLDVP